MYIPAFDSSQCESLSGIDNVSLGRMKFVGRRSDKIFVSCLYCSVFYDEEKMVICLNKRYTV